MERSTFSEKKAEFLQKFHDFLRKPNVKQEKIYAIN